MLLMLLSTQFSGIISNVTLYASEIASEEPMSYANITSELEVSSENEADSETEMLSDEVVSEVKSSSPSSEAMQSETTNVVTSDASERSEESNLDVDAQLEIIDDGALKSSVRAIPTDFRTDESLEENENLSSYENDLRLNANSGEASIKITPTSKSSKTESDLEGKEVYYTLDEEGNISSGSLKQPRSYEGNLITVYDGNIVGADSAIARTSGGYDTTFYVYSSISDLQSDVDGVPISGGGFDATYIETVKQDGVYYDHVKISGYEGYTEAGNIQIIPEELIQSRSYYTVEDGSWVYYSAIDPLTSTDYDVMAIGSAPSTAVAGTKYYSDDDMNYYTEQIISPNSETKVSYNSYFQNLPFRSSSGYSASNFKNYLKAKSKTNSEYYNETAAFRKAEDLESVNALMIFSMANHESAYGTSTYAKACYNFFGRGAIDSDPDKACQSYSYNTATDGILAQALFLENGYFDVLDWRYSGTHVGNKASGMNVKYASDVDWGKKISNHAYMMDQYMGGKEENKYAILQVSGVSHVYKDSGLTTKLKSSGDSSNLNFYDLSQMAGTSNTINVVALAQNNKGYQIYPPTSVKKDSGTDCSYTSSMRGSYPNYNGRSKISVATDTANYSCDYGSFSSSKYWVKKSGTSVINNKSIPYTTKNIYEYYPNGKVKYKFVINSSTNNIEYAYGYDSNGKITDKYLYFSGTKYGHHGDDIQTHIYMKNEKPTTAKTYNKEGKVAYYYQYYSDATLSNYTTHIQYRFNINTKTGYINDAFGYPNNGSKKRTRIYKYEPNTKYGHHGNRIVYKYETEPGSDVIYKAYRYNSNGDIDKAYEYQANTKWGQQGTKTFNNVFWLKGSEKEIDYAIKYKNGQKYIKYTYDPGTIYGKSHGKHIKNKVYY